jgi:four helix bundle protein
MKKDKNYLLEKSTELALQVVQFCDLLFELRKNEIARQLLRSGTSIGANIREAQQAESAADFLHKLRLSAKECSET